MARNTVFLWAYNIKFKFVKVPGKLKTFVREQIDPDNFREIFTELRNCYVTREISAQLSVSEVEL